jgi:5-methylcytosine-specific restriction endonuclease McrA
LKRRFEPAKEKTMNEACKKGSEMAAKLLGGQHWSEEEKNHFLACELCQKSVWAALDRKRKTQGPPPDADRARSEALRALDRVRQIYLREFGISLPSEPTSAKAS